MHFHLILEPCESAIAPRTRHTALQQPHAHAQRHATGRHHVHTHSSAVTCTCRPVSRHTHDVEEQPAGSPRAARVSHSRANASAPSQRKVFRRATRERSERGAQRESAGVLLSRQSSSRLRCGAASRSHVRVDDAHSVGPHRPPHPTSIRLGRCHGPQSHERSYSPPRGRPSSRSPDSHSRTT